MTKITDFDADGGAVTGEIYLCEDYAKELYGSDDLTKPTTAYDVPGINIIQKKWSYFELGDDPQKFTASTVDLEQEIIPSRFFADANDMFSYDQFKPTWLRNPDLSHELSIVIVDETMEETLKDEGKKCFRKE